MIARGTINNINKLETVKRKEFDDIKRRIEYLGRSDYEYRRAEIWVENYLKSIKKYSNYENYDKLIKYLSKYKNPITFFKLFKDNTEILIEDYLNFISDQTISQEQFNQLLKEIGVLK